MAPVRVVAHVAAEVVQAMPQPVEAHARPVDDGMAAARKGIAGRLCGDEHCCDDD